MAVSISSDCIDFSGFENLETGSYRTGSRSRHLVECSTSPTSSQCWATRAVTCPWGVWPWPGSSVHWRSRTPPHWAAWGWSCCSDRGSHWCDSPPQCHWWSWASAWATPVSGSGGQRATTEHHRLMDCDPKFFSQGTATLLHNWLNHLPCYYNLPDFTSHTGLIMLSYVVSLPCQVMVASKFNQVLSLSYWKTSYRINRTWGCVYLHKDHVEFCDVHTLFLKTQKQAIFKRLNFSRFDYMQCRITPQTCEGWEPWPVYLYVNRIRRCLDYQSHNILLDSCEIKKSVHKRTQAITSA